MIDKLEGTHLVKSSCGTFPGTSKLLAHVFKITLIIMILAPVSNSQTFNATTEIQKNSDEIVRIWQNVTDLEIHDAELAAELERILTDEVNSIKVELDAAQSAWETTFQLVGILSDNVTTALTPGTFLTQEDAKALTTVDETIDRKVDKNRFDLDYQIRVNRANLASLKVEVRTLEQSLLNLNLGTSTSGGDEPVFNLTLADLFPPELLELVDSLANITTIVEREATLVLEKSGFRASIEQSLQQIDELKKFFNRQTTVLDFRVDEMNKLVNETEIQIGLMFDQLEVLLKEIVNASATAKEANDKAVIIENFFTDWDKLDFDQLKEVFDSRFLFILALIPITMGMLILLYVWNLLFFLWTCGCCCRKGEREKKKEPPMRGKNNFNMQIS